MFSKCEHYYTCGAKSQLSTSHLSVISTPEVVTHCTPFVVVADLHTSTSGSASSKSDGSLCAGDSSATHTSISNVPRHWTLDRQITPVRPLVKPDVIALAPGVCHMVCLANVNNVLITPVELNPSCLQAT
jgi:hypothetical protein